MGASRGWRGKVMGKEGLAEKEIERERERVRISGENKHTIGRPKVN